MNRFQTFTVSALFLCNVALLLVGCDQNTGKILTEIEPLGETTDTVSLEAWEIIRGLSPLPPMPPPTVASG